MKTRIIYTLFLTVSVALMIGSFSSGPASSGLDRSGSPLANGAFCGDCHQGGSFNPTLTFEVLDGDDPIQNYIPGQTYTVRFTLEATNNPAAYGFQMVALQGNDNEDAGTFATPPAGFQLSELNNRTYVEHASRSSTNVLEVEWTAPDAGTGDVRFYAAGNAVNGANGSGGDNGVKLDEPLTLMEGNPNSTVALNGVQFDFEVFPNPALDEVFVKLESELSTSVVLQLVNAHGQTLETRRIGINPGITQEAIDLSNLAPGMYFALLNDGKEIASHRIIKK